MKRFYYDNIIAKILLAFSSCHTITIGPFVFSKRNENTLTQEVKNHETCHSYQWIELACLIGAIILILQLAVGITGWWYLLAAVFFYIWYGIEFLIKWAKYRDWSKAYKQVSFEQEAYASEHDNNHIENRYMFTSWLKYL